MKGEENGERARKRDSVRAFKFSLGESEMACLPVWS